MVVVVGGTPIAKFAMQQLADQGFKTESTVEGTVDVYVLDYSDGDIDTLDKMLEIRQEAPTAPVIVLTGSSVKDRIRVLDMGADAAMAAPFVPEELAAQIRAVLRRTVSPEAVMGVIQTGDLEIDLARRAVRKDGKSVLFSPTEWQLLNYLARHPGRVVPNEQILTDLWGEKAVADMAYLRVWISRLRRKLEDDPENPRLILTSQGVGYMLAEV